MKRIYLLFILCLLVLGINAQGIEFFHGTYEAALKKAQTEKKNIFVDVYTSWCGPCRIMATTIFPLKEVGDYYNNHYICLKLDAEKEKDHGFFKNYKASAFPTYFWLDSNGKLLDTKTGTASAETFIQYGKKAADSNLNQLLDEGRKRWESGERSLELVKTYVLGALNKVHPEQVKDCLMDYFSTLSEEDLKKKENYMLMKGFMRMPEDNVPYRSLMKYADIYQQYEKGADFWISMYRMNVRAGSAVRNNAEKYNAHLALLKNCESTYKDMYLEILEIENILFEKNFKEGIPMAMNLVEKYEKHTYLYSQFFYTLIIAGFFDKSVQDAETIDMGIALADKALRATPSKETLLYQAATYAKKGDYKKAYEFMCAEPFFPMPMLSNALYPRLGIPVIHRQYLEKK